VREAQVDGRVDVLLGGHAVVEHLHGAGGDSMADGPNDLPDRRRLRHRHQPEDAHGSIRNLPRTGILFCRPVSGVACPPSPAGDADSGAIGFALRVAPGITINTISWNITDHLPRSGTVNVQNKHDPLQVGGLRPAPATIALTATT
jgi:hypothetical protein